MNSDRNRRRISAASISSAHEGRLRRRSSVSQQNAPEVVAPVSANQFNPLQGPPQDMEIDELEQSMSALRFVPASVTRNRARTEQTHNLPK